MNLYKLIPALFVSLCLVSLFGCGGGSSSSGSPFGGGTFNNISSSSLTSGITLLSPAPVTVDANGGQVKITVQILRKGVARAGIPVTFNIVAPTNGVATIDPSVLTVSTDANGQARTTVITGNSSSTTNVIVSASATVDAIPYTANTTFQIVRGTGVISYGPLPAKSATVDTSLQVSQIFQQQISLKLTDANGNPRVGIPITLSDTQTGTALVVIAQPTSVNTDASGTALFNVTVTMPAITADSSVIYKATTNDPIPVEAYAAGYYSVTAVSTTGQGTISLTTDKSSYDANNATVLATAKITKNGQLLSGVPVTFSIVGAFNGPATIEPGLTTVSTDSNGIAITRITTGNVQSTTNVILQATASTGISATTSFQLVRGSAVFTFPVLAPLTYTVPYNSISDSVSFMQLVPFKLTDANGNPRVGIPVTLDLYSVSGLSDVVFNNSNNLTVTTDDSGSGVFNFAVRIPIPATPGSSYAGSLVFRALTNDPIPVTGYVGLTAYSSKAAAP